MFIYLLKVQLIRSGSFDYRNLRLKDLQKRSKRLEPHQANLRRENRLKATIL